MEVVDRKKKHEKNTTPIIAGTEHVDQESWSEMEDATLWKLRTGGRIANSEASNLDTYLNQAAYGSQACHQNMIHPLNEFRTACWEQESSLAINNNMTFN